MDTAPPLPPLAVTGRPTACRDDACCAGASPPAMAFDPGQTARLRTELIRRAFRLEYATVAWMVVEAVIAVWAGAQAASVCLLAFGIDSLIELASAGVLIWRLIGEPRHGQAFAEGAERAASRVAGGLLFALAAYVVAAAGWKLWMRTGATFSWPGLVVTMLAMPTMYVLARQKLAVAEALGSRVMR